MALQHDGGSSPTRIWIALLTVLGGLLIGMAVGFLVNPGEMKKAMIARLSW